MRHLIRRRFLPAACALALAGPLSTCATNPVTGKSELSLVSESQEIAMGKEYAQQIVATMGAYPDQSVQDYVSGIGKRLAAISERPNLPWTFTVMDDPVVNAFALPGGYIFVTRGILTHMNSEAELASVLGHEIGHVTAKHSVRQISRAQLAQVGLGVGAILSEDIARYGGIAAAGLSILFLKYGRDDETQADALGFRYALRQKYDVREMADMFVTLERVSALSGGGGGVPEWLSTHPNPGNRVAKTMERIDSAKVDLSNTIVNRDEFLRHVDNMVFGENPRQGFFEGSSFKHPDLKFQVDFPPGWKTQNMPEAVIAVSEQEDAVLQLTLVPNASPDQAAQQFLGQEGVQAGPISRTSVNGNQAVTATFSAQTQEAPVRGRVTFISYGGATYQLLGYTPTDRFSSYDDDFSRTAGSFRRLTDQRALSVQPRRVELVRLPRTMTVAEFYRQYPSTIPVEHVAIINGVEVDGTLEGGKSWKRVVGGSGLPASP